MNKRITVILIIFLLIISICTTASAFTIVLDPGHGGKDVGSISDDGSNTYESEINLKIAQYLRNYLKDYNDVSVLLTHEGISGDSELSVFDRAICARNNNADLFVSLHINSYDGNSSSKGAEVYVTANTSLPKYKEQTSILATKVLNKLGELNISSRGVKTKLIERDTTDVYSDGTRADYYGVIRYAMRGCHIDDGYVWGGTPANVQNGEGVPTILIEHCFIKGSDFTNFLNTDEKIRNIAVADGKAIVEHYGLTKKRTIEYMNITRKNETLANIEIGTTASELKNKIKISSDLYIEITDKNGNVIQDTKKIGTGAKVLIKEKNTNEIIQNSTVVIYGDTDGDGILSSKDALAIIKNKIGDIKFENEYYLEAGRITENTRNNKAIPVSADALAIIKCKTNKLKITQSY